MAETVHEIQKERIAEIEDKAAKKSLIRSFGC